MPTIRHTLFDVLEILRVNLEQGIDLLALGDNVVLSNIGFADGPPGHLPAVAEKVVVTLIKVEEEPALRNQPAYRRHPVTSVLEYANPPVFLNLFLLISANYNDYSNALIQLSRAVGYFQHKKVFVDTDPDVLKPPGSPVLHFDFNLSLVPLTFDQVNQIWGLLGGRLLPHVLYKMQLVSIEYVPDEVTEAPLIEIIELQEKIF